MPCRRDLLGRGRSDEKGDEWRRDPVVETALDVERSPNPRRNGLVGDDRQAERRVGGRQDRGDQCRRRPPDLGKHEVGQQRAGHDRQRQPDEQQPAGQTGVALDVPQPDRRRIGEQQQGQRQLGDGHDRLVGQRERENIQPARTQDRAGGDEHHRAGDPPPVELRRHQRVGHDDDRESGQTTHQIPLPRRPIPLTIVALVLRGHGLRCRSVARLCQDRQSVEPPDLRWGPMCGLPPIPRIVDAKRIVDAELAEDLQRILPPVQSRR